MVFGETALLELASAVTWASLGIGAATLVAAALGDFKLLTLVACKGLRVSIVHTDFKDRCRA